MAKDRYAVTCNGRPAFYASMYEDIRKCAMDLGWAVALHGSLASDMDVMAMPWTDTATNFETLVVAIVSLFDKNEMVHHRSIDYFSKPHGRTVATIPIWEDFYLDISTIDTRKPMEQYEELERKLQSVYGECDGLLEKVVEGLVKHEGAEIGKPMKARLLTDEDVDKWDRLKGAMERIVERLEETKGKDIVFCPPRTNNKTVMLGQRIGLDRAIEIVKEEMENGSR